MNKQTCLALSCLAVLTSGRLAAADPPAAANTSPVGKWKWSVGPALSFDARGSVTGAKRPAVWFWLDEDKREIEIVWGGPVPGLDKMTLSQDGNLLKGSNNDGIPISGSRLAEALSPAETAAANSPVGTWSWFFGPDLTFQADGTVTGENRTARWVWVDQGKRQLRVEFGGEWSAYQDTVILSADGSHLQGANNFGTDIGGDRLAAPPAPASPSTDATPPAK